MVDLERMLDLATPWWDLAAHPRIGAEFDALMGPSGHGVPDFDIELSDGWETVRFSASGGTLAGKNPLHAVVTV